MSPEPRRHTPRSNPAARTQVLLSAGVGVVAGALSLLLIPPVLAILFAWDVAAAVYVAAAWLTIWRIDARETATIAVREDPTRTTMHLLLLTAAVVSLVAVGVVLVSAARVDGSARDTRVALGLVSVVVSWSLVHTVFALRYAAEYYTGTPGGISFNEDDPPDFADFAYLALSIGMTYQVSDTDLQTKRMRRLAVQHAMLSFVFGTGVVATTVNLVASLTTK